MSGHGWWVENLLRLSEYRRGLYPGSSAGQSIGFLIRGSRVRIAPGVPSSSRQGGYSGMHEDVPLQGACSGV